MLRKYPGCGMPNGGGGGGSASQDAENEGGVVVREFQTAVKGT